MEKLASDVKVVDAQVDFSDARLRTPLKFGLGAVEAITSCTVKITVESRRGEVATGLGNILLSDLWAFPSLQLSHEERDRAMRRVAEEFCKLLVEQAQFGHPVDLYMNAKPQLGGLLERVGEELKLAEPMPMLAGLVCASPADAAVHDAFGKVNGISSYDGYGPQFTGWDLSKYCGPQLAGKYLSDYIHSSFKPVLSVWHVVGGGDKLTRGEISDDDPQDGLPVSLDQWIERDGIFCFKVKLRGTDIEWDVERTAQVAAVIEETYERLGMDRRFYLSGDSNEMNESPETVVEYLVKLRERAPRAYKALLYLEQPTERELEAHCFDMHPVTALKPVVVDEAITDLEKFDQAMELGWSGVGLKTCKGHSSSLLYVAKAKQMGKIVTFQDLTNPGLSMVHEAGFAARIDTLMGFEYNARQYLPNEALEVQQRHRELFTVRDGTVRTASLGKVGLGY